jgi:dihydrofolate reductase
MNACRLHRIAAAPPRAGAPYNGPMVRRVVYAVSISLDGYIARRNGDVDFLVMPEDYSMEAFFETIDTAVMGRKTFEVSRRMGGPPPGWSTPMFVLSRTAPAGEHEGVVFAGEAPGEFVAALRQRPGKNIWLMGGGELAAAFLAEDLVDELHLGVVPVLLGEGIPAFPAGFPQRDLVLVDSLTYSKGLISLRYERSRPNTAPRRRRSSGRATGG